MRRLILLLLVVFAITLASWLVGLWVLIKGYGVYPQNWWPIVLGAVSQFGITVITQIVVAMFRLNEFAAHE